MGCWVGGKAHVVFTSVVIRRRRLRDNGMRLSLCGNPKRGGSLDNTEYDGNDVDSKREAQRRNESINIAGRYSCCATERRGETVTSA